MRASARAGLFLLAFSLWIVAQSGPSALGKGRGGGGGRKGASGRPSVRSGGRGGGHHVTTPTPQHRPSAKQAELHGKGKSPKTDRVRGGQPTRSLDRIGGGEQLHSAKHATEGSHPWSMQRANEQRKLNHRLSTADKLDQIAERNGNDRLYETAERMRQKAYEHYDKRMAKIDSKEPVSDLWDDAGDDLTDVDGVPGVADLADVAGAGDAPELADSSDSTADVREPLSDAIGDAEDADDPRSDLLDPAHKLTGGENALYRQLRNEQRKLAKRMEVAQHLWDAYDQIGDERLAEAARRFEEQALDHYQKRLDAVRSFQQRHGLADIIGDLIPPSSIHD